MGFFFVCPLVTFYKVPLRQLFASDFIGAFQNGDRAFMKSHLYLSIFYVSNFEPTYYFCIYTFISYYHPSTYLQRKKNRM